MRMPGNATVGLALLFAAAVVALAAEDAAGPDPGRFQFLAPDGIPYDNEDSRRIMQKKPLSGNLLANGSFESGRYWPSSWQATDGLTTFWIAGGSNGKRCLRIYTDVLDAQWKAREDEVRAAVAAATERAGGDPQKLPKTPLPPAPERVPTSPPYYNTVAGLHGVHYRCEYVKVQPRAIYRFAIDARAEAEGEPKVFVKGFYDHKLKTADGYETVRRDAYHSHMILDPCDRQWRRYARELHPWLSKSTLGGKPLKPEWLQVQIYAFWKPGDYYFDNVRLDVVGMEKPEPPKDSKQADRPGPGTARDEPPELDKDGFPVFDP